MIKNQQKCFVLLTAPFQLIFAENTLNKLKLKKNIKKIALIIHPSINQNSKGTIKKVAKKLDYEEIIDLSHYFKKFEKIAKISFIKKFFNSKELKRYTALKKKIRLKLLSRLKISSKDIFILRLNYNFLEEFFYFQKFKHYYGIREGIAQEYFLGGAFGILNSAKNRTSQLIYNSLFNLRYFYNLEYFREIIRRKSVIFKKKIIDKRDDKKIKYLVSKISKKSDRLKKYKIIIFGHPLIENKKVFNTNAKKEAQIYNEIFNKSKNKFNLTHKDIILKIHPRVSYENYLSIKKYLKFQTFKFNDYTLSESLLLSKKLKAVYATGSSILLYSKFMFNKKSFYVDISNQNINMSYAIPQIKLFKRLNFDIVKLNSRT